VKAHGSKLSPDQLAPLFVAAQFVSPKGGSGTWLFVATVATMPETAIDENRDP